MAPPHADYRILSLPFRQRYFFGFFPGSINWELALWHRLISAYRLRGCFSDIQVCYSFASSTSSPAFTPARRSRPDPQCPTTNSRPLNESDGPTIIGHSFLLGCSRSTLQTLCRQHEPVFEGMGFEHIELSGIFWSSDPLSLALDGKIMNRGIWAR